jgi:hypothetical protein
MFKNLKIKIGCGHCRNLQRDINNKYFCGVSWGVGWFMFEKVSRHWWISEGRDDLYTKDKEYGGIDIRVIHDWRDIREDCDYDALS